MLIEVWFKPTFEMMRAKKHRKARLEVYGKSTYLVFKLDTFKLKFTCNTGLYFLYAGCFYNSTVCSYGNRMTKNYTYKPSLRKQFQENQVVNKDKH